MVTTTALVGIAAGVPLGLLIGRLLWRRVAQGMNITPSVVAPLTTVGLASVGALVVANLVGLVPAALAAPRSAGTDLRSE